MTTALPDSKVDITDLRGDGDHYAAHVVSKAFVGKTRVQQHQMVYDALGGGMGMGPGRGPAPVCGSDGGQCAGHLELRVRMPAARRIGSCKGKAHPWAGLSTCLT